MRACFIGDSMVVGVGDREARGWVGRVVEATLAGGVDVTAYNLGIRRDTSGDVLARWEREATARFPEGAERRLCFSFGANDCADDGRGAPRIPLDRGLANAEAILGAASAMAPTIMIGPLPILDDDAADGRIAILDARLTALCDELGVPYQPVFETMRATPAWTDGAARGDGTHPDAHGYAALAEAVVAWGAHAEWSGLSGQKR